MYGYMDVWMYVRMHACIYAYTCMYMYVYMCTSIYMYTVYKYTHANIIHTFAGLL